jgi:hypothetical protein
MKLIRFPQGDAEPRFGVVIGDLAVAISYVAPGHRAFEISFERLGSLHCRFAEPARKLLPSRWPQRTALQKYHA